MMIDDRGTEAVTNRLVTAVKIALLVALATFLFYKLGEHVTREAIENNDCRWRERIVECGAGEWKVNPKTGERRFVLDAEEPVQVKNDLVITTDAEDLDLSMLYGLRDGVVTTTGTTVFESVPTEVVR